MPVSSRRIRLCFLIAGLAWVLGGCGGGGGGSDSGAPNSAPQQSTGHLNAAPTISGSPATQVMQAQAYAFTPTANDADGDTLTFSIANKPSWATFNATNGRLSGTPAAGDVGTYSNVTISVSDGTATTGLAAFSIQVVATATASVTLSWTPPTQNTDGSALTDLAGYKVYWGTTQGSYPNSVTLNNPGLASYVVDQLTPATWYFAMSALNNQGIESALSNSASKLVP
jgi:hypothetical protein